MKGYEEILKALMEMAYEQESLRKKQEPELKIPLGISNRHLHLSQKDLDCLFGSGYSLTPIKDLSQPGQYACKETVTICGPKGSIEKVRVLGPVRPQTQVELLGGDHFKLGVKAPVRMSGDLAGTPGITLVGPKGTVVIQEGVIVAQRHIHMTPKDAEYFQVQDGDIVELEFEGERAGSYRNVIVRVTDASALECHLDIEEANAMNLTSLSLIKIIN